ncbi:MAG: hypothetical protein K8S97_10940 [Anaerolineae bacterium]|nr:hypothetical protein [Anaerolineae bacterium]
MIVIAALLFGGGLWSAAQIRGQHSFAEALTLLSPDSALAFPLVYVDDLDGAGGFRLDVLIGQMRVLQIFRVDDAGALTIGRRPTCAAIRA